MNMKSVMLSIKPQWCEKIASGKKSFELRKFAPKEVPFKAYIYCAKIPDKKHRSGKFNIGRWEGNGHVIGEFICDKTYPIKAYTSDGGDAARERRKFLETFSPATVQRKILFGTCLSEEKIFDYIGEEKFGYAWHISNLKIYDKPKELSEFYEQQKANLDVEICSECEREQSKAIHERDKEIDRLKAENKRLSGKLGQILLSIDTVKEMNAMCNIDVQRKQAVKEFAEQVKKCSYCDNTFMDGKWHRYVFVNDIDKLFKEYEKRS